MAQRKPAKPPVTYETADKIYPGEAWENDMPFTDPPPGPVYDDAVKRYDEATKPKKSPR